MKIRSLIRYAFALLVVAFVVTSAGAQEAVRAKYARMPPKADNIFGSASGLLKPPNTSSPRTTLKSFIDNMSLAYTTLMRAHPENMQHTIKILSLSPDQFSGGRSQEAESYKSLWRVERTFCEEKSTLEVRPLFH